MTVSSARAPTDSASASHTSGGALMQLALLGPFTDQISRARVARHARCADGDLDPTIGSRSAPTQTVRARRRPLRSLSAPPAWYVANAWRCRCGTGTSASTESGAAWSRSNARHCAAGSADEARGRPDRHPTPPRVLVPTTSASRSSILSVKPPCWTSKIRSPWRASTPSPGIGRRPVECATSVTAASRCEPPTDERNPHRAVWPPARPTTRCVPAGMP
jgi:hypothetical protein